MGLPHDFTIDSAKNINHIAQNVPTCTARDYAEQVTVVIKLTVSVVTLLTVIVVTLLTVIIVLLTVTVVIQLTVTAVTL